jgi:hypothetical protein
MMDRDPERLSEAMANGFAGELLRAAREEAAPAAVRERVLSTLAVSAARANANMAAPISTHSGVFERRDEGASVEGEARAADGRASSVLRASSAARGAVGCTGTAPLKSAQMGVFTYGTSSTWGETKRGLRAPTSSWQLAAAVLAGVVLAKSLHWAAEGPPSSHEAAAIRVVTAAGTPVALRGPDSVTVPQREPTAAISATVARAGVSAATERVDAVSPGRVSPQAQSPKALAPDVDARRARPCPGCLPPEHPARNVPSRITLHAEYEQGSDRHLEFGDDDWLGEQLELLSRAERSLLAGNPVEALRSLDEYRARFPRGLVDLQIAALQERAAQRSVESFIFP